MLGLGIIKGAILGMGIGVLTGLAIKEMCKMKKSGRDDEKKWLMISTIFTSLLSIWLLILSARIIALRGASFLKFFAFNNFGEEALNRSIKAQGNFIEYTPFFLILLFIAEFNGSHPHFLYLISSLFLISRLMHSIGFSFLKHSPFLRVGGTLLTFISILLIALYNIYEVFYWVNIWI